MVEEDLEITRFVLGNKSNCLLDKDCQASEELSSLRSMEGLLSTEAGSVEHPPPDWTYLTGSWFAGDAYTALEVYIRMLT